MTVGACILVVDDEHLIALGFKVALERMGMRVCGTAATAARAVELALEHNPSLVLMDVRLKGAPDGVDAAQEIHRRLGVPVIFVTGSREPETLARINDDHPADVLFKPVLPGHLRASIEKALQRPIG